MRYSHTYRASKLLLIIGFLLSLNLEGQVVLEPSYLLIGRDSLPANGESVTGNLFFFNQDKGALRAGFLESNPNWSPDSIGQQSIAWGRETRATAQLSTAWGTGAIAKDDNATAWGELSEASGSSATAWGFESKASNSGATAWGSGTIASDLNATAWGEEAVASATSSTAWGNRSKASGYNSTAWGNETEAIANNSTTWGDEAKATSLNATAWGEESIATGSASTATGKSTIANGENSFVVGQYNDSIVSPMSFIADMSPLFIVGNGENVNSRSNAMVIYKSGEVDINGKINLTQPNQNTFLGNQAGNINNGSNNSFFGSASGLISSGNDNSLFGKEAGGLLQLGDDNSFFGENTGAGVDEINRSTFIGAQSSVKTLNNILDKAIAIGYNAKVDCSNCAVIGGTGSDEVKLGIGVESPTHHLTIKGSDANFVADMAITSGDALIELGIGRNGPHGIAFGDETIGKGVQLLYRTTPDELVIEKGSDLMDNPQLVVFDTIGNIKIKESLLDLSGNCIIGTCTSDRRLKKDIRSIGNQLNLLTALNPVIFGWNIDQNKPHEEIGLIAQEVEEVIPEMVITTEEGTKKIRYDVSLQVRFIKALQEQQSLIDYQSEKIKTLENELREIKELLKKNLK